MRNREVIGIGSHQTLHTFYLFTHLSLSLRISMILKSEGKLERMDPITVLIPNSWSHSDLEKITQILFEKLNVPALYLLEEPLAAMYGVGNITGLVIDIGHETTDITAIYDNTPIQVDYSIDVGGKTNDSLGWSRHQCLFDKTMAQQVIYHSNDQS
jgi:actin-related protein